MDEIFAAERLLLARHRRGLNKTQLAKRVGVTASTITAFERADREPPSETVARLAEVLDFPVDFFFTEMTNSLPLDAASFRSLARMTAGQRNAALASGTLAIHLNEWITNKYRLPEADVPELDPVVIDPEGAARHVRTHWGLGLLPIPNVLRRLEAHGIRVFALGVEYREVDAFSFWDNGTPYIIAGTHKTPERQVFDLAHELGHLVLHRDHAKPRGRDEERQADAFASNFLMPREDVIRAAPRSASLASLAKAKHRWRVSLAALAFRLHSLNLITDWHYHTLCVQIASVIGRDKEVDSLPREQSQTLTKVLALMREDGLSRADLAAALHVHQPEIDGLLGGLVVSVIDGGGEGGEPTPPTLRLV